MALFDQESQFTHLLNPIRDLTKNWNVDIAFHLEDYLEKLEQISISFDGGKTTMNFVQAALLIQGSACVYGKKVDFLYNLVLQLLDLLKTNKKERQQNEHRNKDGARDDQFEEFVPLDITASDNIDLKDENEVPVKMIPRNYFHRLKSDKSEKGDFPIYNIKNDLVGNKNDFGIHFNRIHRTGTTLQSLAMYSSICIGKSGQLVDKAASICGTPLDVNHNVGNEEINHASSLDCAGAGDNDDGGGADDVMPNDDGDSLPDADGRPHEDGAGDVDAALSPDVTRRDRVPEISKTYDLRKRKDVVTAAEKALLDWKPLNPQEALPSKLKIAQKGAAKTSKDRKPRKAKKKQKTENGEEKLNDIADFCNDAFFSHAHKLPKDAHKHPSYSFLDQAFYEEMKRRKLEMQKLKSEKDGDASDGSESDFGDNGGDLVDNLDDGDVNDPITMPDLENRIAHNGTMHDDDQFDDLLGTSNSHNTTNYEDLINKYKGGVFEPYERITGIAKKVKEWEESLSEVLEDEEHHTSFNIQTYCTKIIENFSQSKQKETINFSKVVRGVNPSEVARYFLATLQLANNSNIDISRDDPGLKTNDVQLTLLSRRQHFQEIDEFHA